MPTAEPGFPRSHRVTSDVPELPEVETTLRGIAPHLTGATLLEIIVRRRDLRQPVTPGIADVTGARVRSVRRRAKYLLLDLGPRHGHLLLHLGMSGSLRLAPPADPFKTHDHIALTLSNGKQLRFHDPRRFGLCLHLPPGTDPDRHPLLRHLGPEPLTDQFGVDPLATACRARSAAIKLVIMDPKVVVGVGNIYASEALFRARIRPTVPARKLSRRRLAFLVDAIREVLSAAIAAGGTTLRDFLHSDGEPGYFRQELFVYERAGQPCRLCGTPVRHQVLGQRSTYWCPKCQKSA